MRPPVNQIAEEKNRNVDVLPRQPPPALMLNEADLEVHSGRVDLLLPDRPGAENVILIHSVETGLFFFLLLLKTQPNKKRAVAMVIPGELIPSGSKDGEKGQEISATVSIICI